MVSIPVTSAPIDPATAAAGAALPGVTGAAASLGLDFGALLAALLGGATPDGEGGTATAAPDDGEVATGTDDAAAAGTETLAPVPVTLAPAAVIAAPAPVEPQPPAAAAPAAIVADAAAPLPPPERATPAQNPVETASPAAEAQPPPPAENARADAAVPPPPVTDAEPPPTDVHVTRVAVAAEPPPARREDAPARPLTPVAATAVAPEPTPQAPTGGEPSLDQQHEPHGQETATRQHTAADAPPELREAAAPSNGAPPARPADAPAHAMPPARDVARPAPETPPAPPLPHPARDVEQLVRLDALRPLRLPEGGEMRFEVTRADLGQIDVHVSVRHDAVTATLTANHEGARDALTAQRSSLEAALGRANLRLDGFSVSTGQQQHHAPQPDPQQHSAPGPGWRPEPSGATTSVAPAEPVRTVTGGLSLRA